MVLLGFALFTAVFLLYQLTAQYSKWSNIIAYTQIYILRM